MSVDLDSNLDLDFAPIAKRIRESVGQQGFMTHIGAELSELVRGSCTLVVDRRPELLQQHGLFHGGVARPAGADGRIQIEFVVACGR